MPDPQQMPGFVKANFGGSQVHSSRIFVPEPVKRDYGRSATKLRFAEHELENRSAQVARNDPELKSCAIGDRSECLEFYLQHIGCGGEDRRTRDQAAAA